jgi:hypothetical protein
MSGLDTARAFRALLALRDFSRALQFTTALIDALHLSGYERQDKINPDL